jgi:hypothetical protein
MYQELSMARVEWLNEQWSQACADDDKPKLAQAFARSRAWPLLVASSGDLDRRALELLAEAQGSSAYGCLPRSAYTRKTRHLAFRLFSREGCLLHETVATPRSKYPYRLFNILNDLEAAAKIREDCPQTRDEYSASFISHYGAEGLTSEAALNELLSLALVCRTSTTRLESLHAHISRLLQANYRNAAKPSVDVVSAEYVLGRLRRRERERRRTRSGARATSCASLGSARSTDTTNNMQTWSSQRVCKKYSEFSSSCLRRSAVSVVHAPAFPGGKTIGGATPAAEMLPETRPGQNTAAALAVQHTSNNEASVPPAPVAPAVHTGNKEALMPLVAAASAVLRTSKNKRIPDQELVLLLPSSAPEADCSTERFNFKAWWEATVVAQSNGTALQSWQCAPAVSGSFGHQLRT